MRRRPWERQQPRGMRRYRLQGARGRPNCSRRSLSSNELRGSRETKMLTKSGSGLDASTAKVPHDSAQQRYPSLPHRNKPTKALRSG